MVRDCGGRGLLRDCHQGTAAAAAAAAVGAAFGSGAAALRLLERQPLAAGRQAGRGACTACAAHATAPPPRAGLHPPGHVYVDGQNVTEVDHDVEVVGWGVNDDGVK